ncbi:MAG: DUF1559 domain-containing protein [Pirellulales bacterium]
MSLVVAGIALFTAFWVVVSRAREAAVRMEATGKLKQVGLAIIHYEMREGRLPWENYDPQGRQLLSWRVHILKDMELSELYDQFNLDESWDSPHNRKLLTQMPDVYKCPSMSDHPDDKTVYVVPLGQGTVFGAGIGVRLSDFAQTNASKIMLLEVDPAHAVDWTRPEDYTIDFNNPSQGLGAHEAEKFLAVFVDGSANRISTAKSPHELEPYFKATSP